jgi:hypothetical protein
MQSQEDYYSVKDVIEKAKTFFWFVIKRWWVLALGVLLGAGLGAIYYYIQKPRYEAVCTFILEEKQNTPGGGLSSIASQFGFDISSMSGGSIFTGDNILDILKSKKIVQQILLSHLDSNVSNTLSLADLYLEFSGLKRNWRKRKALAQINFIHPFPISPVQDSVLNIIYDKVVKNNLTVDRTSKRGTIIKVQVAARNSQFATLMTERLVEEASKMYLSIKTGNALANINRLQRRSDSLLALLNNKSFAVASMQPLDANPGLKTVAVPSEIAMRDKTVLATLYTEVTKNLETSKLLLSQQTPIIQLLDKPDLSLYDNKKSFFFLLLVGSFVSFVIFFALISMVYFFGKYIK